jgi:hypothetical protein
MNMKAEPNGLDSLESGTSETQPDEPIKKTSMKAVSWLLVVLAGSNTAGSRALQESTNNKSCLKYQNCPKSARANTLVAGSVPK